MASSPVQTRAKPNPSKANPSKANHSTPEKVRKRKAVSPAAHSATQDESTGSQLLDLPAELRNNIYRLVLVEPEPIIVDTAPYIKIPGLLAVNKATRHEGAPIFHQENTFKFYIRDFNHILLRNWVNSSKYMKGSKLRFYVIRSTNWSNLLAWLKDYHDGVITGIGEVPQGRDTVVSNCFEMVRRLKGDGLSWERIAENLELVGRIVVKVNELGLTWA